MQRLFIILMFLRKQSWRNSFAMKLCGNCIFSITKFSEMWWNDGVFEGSEEHWKLWSYEDVKLKYFAFWRDSSLCCASFRMTGFCFLLTIRNLNYFWNAKIFYSHYVFKGAKLAKFIRCEAGWKMIRDTRCELRGVSISITKFTELWWNDGGFEGSEEHWKLWRCEVEIFCFLKRFFTMLCLVQNDTVLFFTYD